jgi:hypothetical protein
MGVLPEATSVLTNKKGFISYIAYLNAGKSALLSQVFEGVTIHNETRDKDAIKFDIAITDFYPFENKIEKQ